MSACLSANVSASQYGEKGNKLILTQLQDTSIYLKTDFNGYWTLMQVEGD